MRRKWIIYTIWGLLLIIPASGYWILVRPLRLHYRYICSEQDRLSMQLLDLREKVSANEAYLKRFARQSSFRQHVLKERLGYAEPDEWVYIFEEEQHD